MTKLEEILQRKKERESRLMTAMSAIVSQLVTLGALKIILFGSLSIGNVDEGSDLDLFVIMPSTRSGKEWSKLIYGNVERGVASDIIVYNQEELEENLTASRFLRDILSSGKVIYEKSI